MNRKKNSGIIAIIILMSFLIPPVQAPNIEVSPTDTEDDAFLTGIGAYFGDTHFMYLKDAQQDLTVGTRFRNVTIPQGSKINNATLFVRTFYLYQPTFGSELSETVTIYGDDADNSLPFIDSGSFTRPYTTESIIWNISEVAGNQWHEVSVTGIVQEIIDRVGWTSGNELSLIIASVKGTPRREFASVDGNPAYVARLNITYAETPPSAPFQEQADAPYNDTGEWIWTKNDTYRGIDIWVVKNDGVNKTGVPNSPISVNWNTLNLTQLIELDSGNALTVNNATWVSISALVAQQIDTLYNDTGPANIELFFVRGGINISAVTNALPVGSDQVMTIASISTATPVGGGGLREGNVGDWVGVTMLINTDDQRWLLRMEERSGAVDDFAATSSAWFDESTNEIIYFEFRVHPVYIGLRLSTDPKFSFYTYSDTHTLTQADDPYRYPQVCSSLAFGTSSVGTGEMYSFLEWDPAEVIFLSYPNGTLICPEQLPCDLDPEDVEEFIDELLGGAQPEDPQEDVYTVIGKFQWKLLVLAVGMIMLLGSPIAGVYYGGDTATWIKILFIMFFGIGILWQIKSM